MKKHSLKRRMVMVLVIMILIMLVFGSVIYLMYE